jgi:hypothetical protein
MSISQLNGRLVGGSANQPPFHPFTPPKVLKSFHLLPYSR